MDQAATATIPESHRDLLTRPVYVTLVTLMPDGQPQANVVWADLEGELVVVNAEGSRQKVKNMRRNPRVTILAVDPGDPYRWIEVRGRVERISEEDGAAVINRLSRKYDGQDYFGGRVPLEQAQVQRRVTFRVRPTRVVTKGR